MSVSFLFLHQWHTVFFWLFSTFCSSYFIMHAQLCYKDSSKSSLFYIYLHWTVFVIYWSFKCSLYFLSSYILLHYLLFLYHLFLIHTTLPFVFNFLGLKYFQLNLQSQKSWKWFRFKLVMWLFINWHLFESTHSSLLSEAEGRLLQHCMSGYIHKTPLTLMEFYCCNSDMFWHFNLRI